MRSGRLQLRQLGGVHFSPPPPLPPPPPPPPPLLLLLSRCNEAVGPRLATVLQLEEKLRGRLANAIHEQEPVSHLTSRPLPPSFSLTQAPPPPPTLFPTSPLHPSPPTPNCVPASSETGAVSERQHAATPSSTIGPNTSRVATTARRWHSPAAPTATPPTSLALAAGHSRQKE